MKYEMCQEETVLFGREWTGKRRILLFIVLIVLILGLLRLSLPFLLLSFVNEKLDSIQGFDGSVEDVDLNLRRGAYRLKNITLKKLHGAADRPFFYADAAEFSIEFKAFKSNPLTGKLVIENPVLTFSKQPAGEVAHVFVTGMWRVPVSELFPFAVGRVEVHDGIIRYIDDATKPVVDVTLSSLNALTEKTTGSTNPADKVQISVSADGTCYGGDFALSGRMVPGGINPAFVLTASFTNISLSAVDSLFEKYDGYGIDSGSIRCRHWSVCRRRFDSGFLYFIFPEPSNFAFTKR